MSPMCPYMALDTTKIHTPITLGVRPCTKPLVFKLRRRSPCGFDSHRPLHSQATPSHAGLQDWGQDIDPMGRFRKSTLRAAGPMDSRMPALPRFSHTLGPIAVLGDRPLSGNSKGTESIALTI